MVEAAFREGAGTLIGVESADLDAFFRAGFCIWVVAAGGGAVVVGAAELGAIVVYKPFTFVVFWNPSSTV